jgi:hypothetical protein
MNRWPIEFIAMRGDETPAGERALAFWRAIGRQPARSRNGGSRLFSAGAKAPLHRQAK